MKVRGAAVAESRPALPAHALRRVAYLSFGVLTIAGLWAWQRWEGAFATGAAVDIGSLVATLFAAACAGWAAWSSDGRIRRGWLAMVVGSLGWAVGDAISICYEVWLRSEHPPYPSWADAFYLLFPAGAVVAVVLLSSPSTGRSRIRLILDGVIVAASLFVISWIGVLGSVLHEGGASPLALAVSLAHPIADVLIITIAWASAVEAYRPSLGLLVAGLIVIALSDSVFTGLTAAGGHSTDKVLDLCWTAGFGILALSALRSIGEPLHAQTPSVIPSRARPWLPYLPVVLATGMVMSKTLPTLNSFPLNSAVVLLVVTVLGRQVFALAENERLLSDVGQLAFIDPLTGMANRTLFLDRLGQAVMLQRRELVSLTLLCLDLDDFKAVNNELGHPAGDELLIRVAERLSTSVRSTDTVARLGGDEFVILLEGPVEDTVAAAQRVLDAFATSIVIDGVALTVRPSIGLTLATPDMPQTTVDDLMRQADLAMYAAKREGGGCLRSFVPDLPNPYDLPEQFPAITETVATPVADATAISDADTSALPDVDTLAKSGLETVASKPRWPPLSVRVAESALVVGVVVVAASIVLRARPGRIALLDDWLYSILLLSASALVFARCWRIAAERWAWLLIAAGMSAAGLGKIVYTLWVPVGQWPSRADLFFLSFYPLVITGLLLLLRRRLQQYPCGPIRLDAVVVGLTVAALTAALATGPIEPATTGSPVKVLVGLAYPTGGLLLLAIAAGSLSILGWRAERRWALLVLGFVLFVIAPFVTARGSYVEGTWIDACWPAALLLIAAAAWMPRTHSGPRTVPRRAPVLLPAVCTLVALSLVVLADGERLAVTLAALSLTAVAVRFAVTFRHVSALAESHHHAMTDMTTGLANRLAVATNLTAATLDQPDSAKVALVVLDLDPFREIAVSLGRKVTDELLCHIATRLSQVVRPTDLLARVGVDEFALLLTQADLTTARAVAGKLMDALRAPFALDHITVQVDASIGVALWPDQCTLPQDLLTCAEAAMTQARTTTSRIAVYDAAADLKTDGDGPLLADLRIVLAAGEADVPAAGVQLRDAGEVVCYYQPKIRAQDESVHSVETLVRWQHPARGLLLPDEFLPSAERAGLMRPVAAVVLDRALAQIRAWRDKGVTLTVAVNLSATNLLDLGLVGTIASLLRTHDLPASALILEVTESTLTTDSRRARNTVAALRRLGTRLSLDDYGTGWSSLARLQDLKVDELKLDRVFVARLARDPRSIAIVRSTVALAHSLDAELVAEGVEDVATLRALRQYGCTITQGNVHSAPLPSAEFERWLTARTSIAAASPSTQEVFSGPVSQIHLR